MKLYSPNSSARVAAPSPGRANTTTPKATDTSPAMMNSARVPTVSPAWKPAKISKKPPMNAQIPTTSTSTSAVGPGQTMATTPAARSTRPSSKWPMTGPAAPLLNARTPSNPASMNAYTANRMTSARIVIPGQPKAMTPTTTASTPRRISDVDTDLSEVDSEVSMAGVPFASKRNRPAGQPLSAIAR